MNSVLMRQVRYGVTGHSTICWHPAFVPEQQHNTLNDMRLPAAGAAERKDNNMNKQPLNRAWETSEAPQPLTDGVGATDPGPRNALLDLQNPDLLTPPRTDYGTIPNLKFSFSNGVALAQGIRVGYNAQRASPPDGS